MAIVNITISPVISGVYVVLENKGLNSCQTMTTNSLGTCSFISLPAGSYSIYNVGVEPDACPPTKCGYPPEYSGTVDPRRIDTTLVAASTFNQTFHYDKAPPWTTLNGGNAPNYGIAVDTAYALYKVNIATGVAIKKGGMSNNGFGYNMADGFIYGGYGRSDATGSTVALNYPNTYILNPYVGDCDIEGYLYSQYGYGFTCINVNSYSPRYLRAYNPYNGYSEITTSPFNVTVANIGTEVYQGADWSYLPHINSMVMPSNVGGVYIFSLTTPISYGVPSIGVKSFNVGSTMTDMKNLYISNSTNIFGFFVTTTVAYGTTIAGTTWPGAGDASRAAGAPVYYAQPVVNKAVDKILTTTGSILTYTVTIVNAGILEGMDSYFYDTIPIGTSFIPNTFSYNGTIIPSTTPSNFYIGTLPIGEVMTITYQALIDSTTISTFKNYAVVRTIFLDSATNIIFDQSFNSNIVTTTVVQNFVSLVKYVNKIQSALGDILAYTLVATNTGTIPANSMRIIDTVPIGTTFVNGSLTANGISQPSSNILPPNGFLYGTLTAGSVITVGFNVNVVSVPSNYNLINYGTAKYNGVTQYGTIGFSIDSNTVVTNLSYANVTNLVKSVSDNFSTIGKVLTYTIVGQNTGNLDAINCIYIDTIPNGLTFIPGTLTVNGLSGGGSPSSINIGNILAGQYITIVYKCLIG